jgi:hypothetical protein
MTEKGNGPLRLVVINNYRQEVKPSGAVGKGMNQTTTVANKVVCPLCHTLNDKDNESDIQQCTSCKRLF